MHTSKLLYLTKEYGISGEFYFHFRSKISYFFSFHRKRYGDESLIRTINYEPCIFARETQKILEKRLNNLDMEVTKPCEILPHRPAYFRSFPILDKSVLSKECPSRYNGMQSHLSNGIK